MWQAGGEEGVEALAFVSVGRNKNLILFKARIVHRSYWGSLFIMDLRPTDTQVNEWRKLFPASGNLVHLNHAGVSPISRRVADAVCAFLQDALNICEERYRAWEEESERVRERCARFIGAKYHQIAFVKNTSEGLSLVAAGVDWRPGDNVVAVEGEYPSNVYPWWALQRRGVELRLVPQRQGLVHAQDLAQACDPRTRVVAVSLVDWATGARNDLPLLSRVAHRFGALFCVDGIQGVGVLPLNVEDAAIDCLAVGGHKWLLAPEGCGWLYLSDRALSQVQSVLHGWKSVTDCDRYLPYHFEPRADALRFEPGSLPHLGIRALGAAVGLLSEVGADQVWQRVRQLTGDLYDGLKRLGAEVISPWHDGARSGIVVFRVPGDCAALVAELNRRGFVVRMRSGGVRAAPHFYNSEQEIARFLAAIADLT